jgi:UDP-3-O-[3-hydroxymyristoyl] N-acetylglucosamine deacetylase
VSHVGAVAYATQLKLGEARVETVEHLLAALASTRIDNAIIELNTPEVPIMDGSSAPFIYLVQEAGVRTLAEPRKYLKVTRPVTLTRGDKQIALFPSDHFKVSYTIGFDHPLLRHQTRTIVLTEDSFIEDIAPARTFTFLKEVEMLRQNGLALGGSLDNAIVISDTGVLNSSLRFEDEFVRHKILDLVGDFALVGHPVIAHAVVHRGGHALHTAMAAHLLQESDAWQLVEEPSAVPVAARTVPVTVTS